MHVCHLFCADAYERARHRLCGDHISKVFTPAFYALLLKQDVQSRKDAALKLLDGIE